MFWLIICFNVLHYVVEHCIFTYGDFVVVSSRWRCLRAVWLCVRLCAVRFWSAVCLRWVCCGPRPPLYSTCWWGTTMITPRGRPSYALTYRSDTTSPWTARNCQLSLIVYLTAQCNTDSVIASSAVHHWCSYEQQVSKHFMLCQSSTIPNPWVLSVRSHQFSMHKLPSHKYI